MAGPLATSLRGLWVSGLLPPSNGAPSQGRRPENRPGGDDSDPGLASGRESSLTAKNKKVLSCQRGLHQHAAKGRDPRTPASWRHWLRRVVAATADMIRLDGRRRLPFRALRAQLYQVLRHRRFCLSSADYWASMLWGSGREAQQRLNFGAVSIFAVSSANYGIFSRGLLRHFSLARDDYKFVPGLSPSSRPGCSRFHYFLLPPSPTRMSRNLCSFSLGCDSTHPPSRTSSTTRNCGWSHEVADTGSHGVIADRVSQLSGLLRVKISRQYTRAKLWTTDMISWILWSDDTCSIDTFARSHVIFGWMILSVGNSCGVVSHWAWGYRCVFPAYHSDIGSCGRWSGMTATWRSDSALSSESSKKCPPVAFHPS